MKINSEEAIKITSFKDKESRGKSGWAKEKKVVSFPSAERKVKGTKKKRRAEVKRSTRQHLSHAAHLQTEKSKIQRRKQKGVRQRIVNPPDKQKRSHSTHLKMMRDDVT